MVFKELTEGVISNNVRSQIVQDVATKMISYCKYPSKLQYMTVAQKIIVAYPILKDSMGIGHVSNLFN